MNFVIVASGPSLTPQQVEYCEGKARVIVINDNYKLAPWAQVMYACDPKWWQWHEHDEDLLNFKGIKYTQDKSWDKSLLARFVEKHKLTVIRSEGGAGFSLNPEIIFQGSNSGYQAINLAYHLGAKRIILIGYDMQATNNKGHWFGEHPDNVRSNYKGWLTGYKSLADHAPKLGIEIINCTTETALTCFERKNLEDVL